MRRDLIWRLGALLASLVASAAFVVGCGSEGEFSSDTSLTTAAQALCDCPDVCEPICGRDGRTYQNKCVADCRGTRLSDPFGLDCWR